MFSDLKRRLKTFFAGDLDITRWYGEFAPKYDKISWQTEIVLKAESMLQGVARGRGGYPSQFTQNVMEKQINGVFGRMFPRFVGAGRKKIAYAFGRRAVVKLALEKDALTSDFAMYDFSQKRGLTCLPGLISKSRASMLCKYAPPPDEKWFTKKFGMPCEKICRLLGLCVNKENPASELEENFVINTVNRINPVYASFNDMQILTSGVFGADIMGNEDNWGILTRHGWKIPVIADCGC